MARRGARVVREPGGPGTASATWRATIERSSGSERTTEEWIDHGEVRDEARSAVSRGTKRPARKAATPRRPAPPRKRAAAPARQPVPEGPRARPPAAVSGDRLQQRLGEATRAFERERYLDARRLLRPLAQHFPAAAEVRELHGLSLYRLGRWKDAVRELEAFRELTGSTEQHPVLADCYRALGQYGTVGDLWQELREASPSAELVAEGRIVAAGALADQGRLADAIGLLEPAVRAHRRPRPHHLRLAYALADLYERAGDTPRARQLFARVAAVDPDFADVAVRLGALA